MIGQHWEYKLFSSKANILPFLYTFAGSMIFGFSEIRLAGGPNAHSGRVEFRHNGVWSTTCEKGWDNSDATVTCRSLGYTGGLAHRFGEGSGPTWVDFWDCYGNETTLAECSFSKRKEGHCYGRDAAGVTCEGPS